MLEHFKYCPFISTTYTKALENKIPFLIGIKAFKILEYEKDSIGIVWKCKAGRFPSYGIFTIEGGNSDPLEVKIRESRKYFLDICLGSAEPNFIKLSLIFKAHWFYNNPEITSYNEFKLSRRKDMISDFLKTHKKNRNIVIFFSKSNL